MLKLGSAFNPKTHRNFVQLGLGELRIVIFPILSI